MRWFRPILLLAALGAGGQQASPSSTPAKAVAAPQPVKVYAVGSGVTAPALLPLHLAPIPKVKCEDPQNGKISFYIIVDAKGRARNIIFFQPVGTELDLLALHVVEADRFRPGVRRGKPVAVARIVQVELRGCVRQTNVTAGRPTLFWWLLSPPRQKLRKFPNPPQEAVFAPDTPSWKPSRKAYPREDYFGGSVTAPELIYSVGAEYTKQAIQKKIQGTCRLSLVVDAHGLPEDVRVLRKLAPGLDAHAIAAVESYRYIPAFRGAEPVPSILTVDVKFVLPASGANR